VVVAYGCVLVPGYPRLSAVSSRAGGGGAKNDPSKSKHSASPPIGGRGGCMAQGEAFKTHCDWIAGIRAEYERQVQAAGEDSLDRHQHGACKRHSAPTARRVSAPARGTPFLICCRLASQQLPSPFSSDSAMPWSLETLSHQCTTPWGQRHC
jgi:hypothetical protein